jgi:hypothetical protein
MSTETKKTEQESQTESPSEATPAPVPTNPNGINLDGLMNLMMSNLLGGSRNDEDGCDTEVEDEEDNEDTDDEDTDDEDTDDEDINDELLVEDADHKWEALHKLLDAHLHVSEAFLQLLHEED